MVSCAKTTGAGMAMNNNAKEDQRLRINVGRNIESSHNGHHIEKPAAIRLDRTRLLFKCRLRPLSRLEEEVDRETRDRRKTWRRLGPREWLGPRSALAYDP